LNNDPTNGTFKGSQLQNGRIF